MDDLKKVSLGSIHLDDVADEWYQNYREVNGRLAWTQFVQEIFVRIEPVDISLNHTGFLASLVDLSLKLRVWCAC